MELVAEGKDELMEEYFAEGTIPEQHLITALHEAIREDRIFPVLFASGQANMAHGSSAGLHQGVCACADGARADAGEGGGDAGCGGNGGDMLAAAGTVSVTARWTIGEPTALLVFKTMTDPFAGRITFFKVISGVVKNDATLENYTRRGQERSQPPERHAGPQGSGSCGAACRRSGRGGQAARDAYRRHAGSRRAADIQVELAPCPSRR